MEAATALFSEKARSTRAMWPRWRNPMVGTRPRAPGVEARAARKSAIVSRTCMGYGEGRLGVLHQLGQDIGVHVEALFVGGEEGLLDVVAVAGNGFGGGCAYGGVGAGVAGGEVGTGGEDVVDDLHLARRSGRPRRCRWWERKPFR